MPTSGCVSHAVPLHCGVAHPMLLGGNSVVCREVRANETSWVTGMHVLRTRFDENRRDGYRQEKTGVCRCKPRSNLALIKWRLVSDPPRRRGPTCLENIPSLTAVRTGFASELLYCEDSKMKIHCVAIGTTLALVLGFFVTRANSTRRLSLVRWFGQLVVLTALLTTCSVVSAGVISVDDSVFGLGSLTRDTVQELDFLDIVFSKGLSTTQVATHLLPGGQFDGFRRATSLEFVTLINHWGWVLPVLPELGISSSAVPPGNSLVGLTNLLGTAATGGQPTAFANTTTKVVGLYTYEPGREGVFWNALLENPDTGFLLVRSSSPSVSSVPEPSSVLLWSALCSVGLVHRPRRKRIGVNS